MRAGAIFYLWGRSPLWWLCANAKSTAQMVLIMPPTQQVGIRTTNHNLLLPVVHKSHFRSLQLCMCVINILTLLASGVFTLRQQHAESTLFTIIHTACSASCSVASRKIRSEIYDLRNYSYCLRGIKYDLRFLAGSLALKILLHVSV